MTAIVWFTFDLRLTDLPCLERANDEYQDVLPVFIYDPDQLHAFGGASQWWLHHSLQTLSESIKEKGGQLVLRQGKVKEELASLVQDSNAKALYFSRAYEPQLIQVQSSVYKRFSQDIEVKRYGGRLLFEPDQISNQQGKPFQVFTPFYKHCLKLFNSGGTVKRPHAINFYQKKLKSDTLNDWHLLPSKPNWAKSFEGHWQPGEAGAKDQAKQAVAQVVEHYHNDRDFPALEGTSKLSPHLAFGEIGPRQLWAQTERHFQKYEECESFLRQLFWRDFSYYLLFHWPHIPEKPFKESFANFPWNKNNEWLKAWQKGQTGYPIVDAGMRQLWQTGWMHNRVRMIVASFLTKHLRLHWRHGAEWFLDTLVDADLANNSAGWQWVAGSGADAAPYFRIFNPILQSEKFDKKGGYIRQWVPELSKLSDKSIHKPWQASTEELADAGITLGKDYPKPLVDHQQAREKALAAYDHIKS